MGGESTKMYTANRRIAKNSIYLAIRTIAVMLITLYTSRIILRNLGVEDFGIYNVVGSVVVFWNSVGGMFAQATQRFLNIVKTEGDEDRLKLLFSTSLRLHLLLAVGFTLLVGGYGFYFVNNQLQIPLERLTEANWVLFFSLMAGLINIFSTPFLAAILANERMGVFALSTILDAAGKLIVAVSLPYITADALISWGLGVLLVIAIAKGFIVLDAKLRCPETSFSLAWDRQIAREVGAFAGWNFVGNTTFHIMHEGLNFVLNIFWGAVANTARGIVYQMHSALVNMGNTLLVASQPQLYRYKGEGNISGFEQLHSLAARSALFFSLCITATLSAMLSWVLALWLGEVPPYTLEFGYGMLAYTQVRFIHISLDVMYKAFGEVKWYHLVESITIVCPLIAFCVFKYTDAPAYAAFIILILGELAILWRLILYPQKLLPLTKYYYPKSVGLPFLKVLVAVAPCVVGILQLDVHPILSGILAFSTCSLFVTTLGYTRLERRAIAAKVVEKLRCSWLDKMK